MEATSQVRTCLIHFLKIGWRNSPHWCPAFCQRSNPGTLSQSLDSTSEHSFSFRSTSSSDALLLTHHNSYCIPHSTAYSCRSEMSGVLQLHPQSRLGYYLSQSAPASLFVLFFLLIFLFSTGWESVRSMSTYRVVS